MGYLLAVLKGAVLFNTLGSFSAFALLSRHGEGREPDPGERVLEDT